MQFQTLAFEATRHFSPLFLDYINQKPKTTELYGEYPLLANFKNQLNNKKFSTEKRKTLVNVLKNQYQNITHHPSLDILLEENTFTVTTGHQLNIFSGPMYIIYKLITTINLANTLKKAYPAYNFVPVYWMATEDHDFEEINHFNLFGKTHHWNTNQKGAVGRMDPKEMTTIFEGINEDLSLFKNAYLSHATLSEATRYLYNELFGKQGLLCIDADEHDLKKIFSHKIKRELIEQSSHTLLEKNTQKLQKLGYKPQITAREINLFYLDNQLRERIIHQDGFFQVLNTSLKFTEKEILDTLEKFPEKFSPNVILRPIYQEEILPNLAYIGGPAEVNYWLQLKDIFDYFDLTFPIVMPRNTAMVISKKINQKIEKLHLKASDFFEDENQLKKLYLEKVATNHFNLDQEKENIKAIFEKICSKAITIDKTLEASVNIEKQKTLSSFETFEKKVKKAEERKHETEIQQLKGVKEKLFPNGSPQERSENILAFLLDNPEFINEMIKVFDPLNFKYCVVYEENS